METGTVSVRNVGSADAGAFVVTVVCNAQGRKGGCAEPRDPSKYEDAAYPNAVVVNVPSLKAGKTFNHKIAFWNGLDWASGDYEFDVTADAGSDVAETNEGNNAGSYLMSVP
jgi:subtilase family serine protease